MPGEPVPSVVRSGVTWFAGAAGIALIADLVTKQVMFSPSISVNQLPSWLIQVYNPGVAWSLFADHPWLVVGLTLVLIPVLIVVWWKAYRGEGRLVNLAFGLVIGGALGNAVDRAAMAFGMMPGVRDFIHVDLGFWPLHPWPTFNIADSAICIGFGLLVVGPWFAPRTLPVAKAA